MKNVYEGRDFAILVSNEQKGLNYLIHVKDKDTVYFVPFSFLKQIPFDLPRTMVTEYGGAPVSGAKEGQYCLELDENEERLPRADRQ